MKLLMITHGSRGDVQPFAALAEALGKAGHTVTLAAPAASAWLAEPFCERLVKLHDGPNELAGDSDVVQGLETMFRGVRGKRQLLETIPKTRRLIKAVLDDIALMAHDIKDSNEQSFDIVVHHVSHAGHDVADFLGVPSVLMCPQPYWVPTSGFQDPSFPCRLPRSLNRTSYVASRTVWWAFSGSTSRWRKKSLGLGRRRGGRFRQLDGSPTTVLQPFSERLLPPATRYPPWVHTTGFWSLSASNGWLPAKALTAFLAAGPPPIYLGFASTVTSVPQRLGRMVREAVQMAQVRAVVAGGWSGISAKDLGPEVILVDEVPFDWLFRRVAVVVHHGGFGTTGTALASGRPQVVCPLMPDQWFAARRMHALGVAPAPIPHRDLAAATLARAIREALNDQEMTTRAEEMARQIRLEDGVAAAVEILESIVRVHQIGPVRATAAGGHISKVQRGAER